MSQGVWHHCLLLVISLQLNDGLLWEITYLTVLTWLYHTNDTSCQIWRYYQMSPRIGFWERTYLTVAYKSHTERTWSDVTTRCHRGSGTIAFCWWSLCNWMTADCGKGTYLTVLTWLYHTNRVSCQIWHYYQMSLIIWYCCLLLSLLSWMTNDSAAEISFDYIIHITHTEPARSGVGTRCYRWSGTTAFCW